MPDARDERLQQILAQLVERRLADSLAQLEEALAVWRRGEAGVIPTHEAALAHGGRARVLSERVARAGLEGALTLLRDALEVGIIDADEFTRLTGRAADEVPPPPSLDEELKTGRPARPEKQAVMGKLINDGPVLVHLDARAAGVDVPASHSRDPRLVLRFGYNLTPQIPDLSFDEEGIHGTLAFRGVPHRCNIPWRAVFALVGEDGRGIVWAEDVPPEVAQDYVRGPEKPPEPPEPPKRPKGGHLKLV